MVVLALALPAVACGEAKTNAWLDALQRERLAHLVPDHGRLELDLETTTGRTAFSKQDSAVVSRGFSYRTRTAAVQAPRAVVLRVAAATGWRVSRYPTYPTAPVVGWKRLSAGDAKLTLGHYMKKGRYRVTITLEPAH